MVPRQACLLVSLITGKESYSNNLSYADLLGLQTATRVSKSAGERARNSLYRMRLIKD